MVDEDIDNIIEERRKAIVVECEKKLKWIPVKRKYRKRKTNEELKKELSDEDCTFAWDEPSFLI